jgi:phosphoglycerol transferase MdoB-like AlkP superfamily enzyme
MADDLTGLPGSPATGGRVRAMVAVRLLAHGLRPQTAQLAAPALWAGIGYYIWQDMSELANTLFTVGVTASLIAVATLLTFRLIFSSLLVAMLVAAVVAASSIKHATMNMVVHAYDLFFYLTSWSTVSYLWSDHTRYVVGAAGAFLAAAIVAVLGYRLDATRIARSRSALVLLPCVLLVWSGAAAKSERRHMLFHFEGQYLSSFYSSWGETAEALWRGALLEADPDPGREAALTIPARCETAVKPPHIVLIHEESLVQPSLFPTLGYDRSLDKLFRSSDGTLRQMRVETYGGASWLTEFSLLAGVSTHSFGNMRQFVQTFMQGRLKDTLPQALARCGYRNVVFYPMLKNFVSNDKFYASIGMREVFDMKSQGAKSVQERDRFYFDNAMAEMARHFKSSSRPLFTFIQTMSAHWPYNFTFEPKAKVPGGAPGTDPEMHEYLRRVSLAKIDYEHLVKELRRRFPRERFLIVHYGDHHPMATRTLLGYNAETEAEDVALNPDSVGFITYFAVQGVNYRVPDLPKLDPLDVSYLGSLILDLADLPLSDSHRERLRLMALCQGRYYSCSRRAEILRFHRRLIDSGIVAAH